jgi:Sulfotransferase family
MPMVGTSSGAPPVAIGGVGGSGTRLVAQLVQELGVHLGSDLNQANDTLWFTLLFKRREILQCGDVEFDMLTNVLVSGLRGGQPFDGDTRSLLGALANDDRPQHPAPWLKARADSLSDAAGRPSLESRWGWKEPNTHVVIERLWQRLPTLRYVHVVRHGLDMAYSSNQNQLGLWGQRMLGDDGPSTPARSLAYWCKVHQCMQELLAKGPERMYWLDYDLLCRQPREALEPFLEFLGYDPGLAANLVSRIQPPGASRHASRNLDTCAPEHVKYARHLAQSVGRT